MVWKCPPLHLPNWSNNWKWKQEMNANELADVLMFTKFQVDEDGTMIGVSHQAVNEATTMLRQQQLKIDNLLENNARLDAEIEVLKSHPANACKHGVDDGACKECYLEATNPTELTDEEIDELHKLHTTLPPKPWKGVPLGSFDVYEFARAILRKASEK